MNSLSENLDWIEEIIYFKVEAIRWAIVNRKCIGKYLSLQCLIQLLLITIKNASKL